ncbi:hypothetical protein BIV01_16445 [Curtobacterium sp. MCBA15_013]|nr:hypothetical protein BIV01_16445 [Curtobacterium sp. MCBA15_013]
MVMTDRWHLIRPRPVDPRGVPEGNGALRPTATGHRAPAGGTRYGSVGSAPDGTRRPDLRAGGRAVR